MALYVVVTNHYSRKYTLLLVICVSWYLTSILIHFTLLSSHRYLGELYVSIVLVIRAVSTLHIDFVKIQSDIHSSVLSRRSG